VFALDDGGWAHAKELHTRFRPFVVARKDWRRPVLTDERRIPHDLHANAWWFAFERLAGHVVGAVRGPHSARLYPPSKPHPDYRHDASRRLALTRDEIADRCLGSPRRRRRRRQDRYLDTDTDTDRPEWALVKTGLFGGKGTFVPLQQANPTPGGLQVPFEKRHVKDAPNVDPDGQPSPSEERTLYEHYGLGYDDSRSGSGTGNGGGEYDRDRSG